jgi:hypothetical protein
MSIIYYKDFISFQIIGYLNGGSNFIQQEMNVVDKEKGKSSKSVECQLDHFQVLVIAVSYSCFS